MCTDNEDQSKWYGPDDETRWLAYACEDNKIQGVASMAEMNVEAERREYEAARSALLKENAYPSDFDIWLAARRAVQPADAHIDAWGARMAGDAADVIEGALVDDVLPYHSPEWIARARTTLEKLKSSKD